MKRQKILDELDRFAGNKTFFIKGDVNFRRLGKLLRLLPEPQFESCIEQMARESWLSFCDLRRTVFRLKMTLKNNRPDYLDYIRSFQFGGDYVKGYADSIFEVPPDLDPFIYPHEEIVYDPINHPALPKVVEICMALFRSLTESSYNDEPEPRPIPYEQYDNDDELIRDIKSSLEEGEALLPFLPGFLDRAISNLGTVYEMIDHIYEQTDESLLVLDCSKELKYMDIIDKVYELFHDKLFRKHITKVQILMLLNNIGGHMDAVADKCKSSFAVMISIISLLYELPEKHDIEKEKQREAWVRSVLKAAGIVRRPNVNLVNEEDDADSSSYDNMADRIEIDRNDKCYSEFSDFIQYLTLRDKTAKEILNEIKTIMKGR